MSPFTRAALILVLSALHSAARADDEQVMHAAAECRALSGTATYNANGDVENRSTTTALQVLCPLTRLDELPTFAGKIWAIDRHNASAITCTAYGRNVSQRFASTPVSTLGTSTAPQELVFLNPSISATFTSRYFVCTLPVAQGATWSSLLMYRGQQQR